MDESERGEAFERAMRLFRLGYEQQMEGNLDRAIEAYQASIRAFPTTEAHTLPGWTYSFQGRLDDAIPYPDRATWSRRYESPCFAHFNLSRIWGAKGQLRRAAEALRSALEANPDYAPARDAYRSGSSRSSTER